MEVNPPLRQAYEKEVYNLKEIVVEMRVAGKSWEEIAYVVSPARTELQLYYRSISPEEFRLHASERNLEKYKDASGTNLNKLIKEGHSWKVIVEKSCRSGGDKVDFNKFRDIK